MPEIDRIIEAEQSIQELAEQLNRMHSAANILQNSKDQVEAVLESSKRVVQITEKFTESVNLIVYKLEETNFDDRFNDIKKDINNLAGQVKVLITWQLITIILVFLALVASIVFGVV